MLGESLRQKPKTVKTALENPLICPQCTYTGHCVSIALFHSMNITPLALNSRMRFGKMLTCIMNTHIKGSRAGCQVLGWETPSAVGVLR